MTIVGLLFHDVDIRVSVLMMLIPYHCLGSRRLSLLLNHPEHVLSLSPRTCGVWSEEAGQVQLRSSAP